MITRYPTCGTAGCRTYTCWDCGQQRTVEIPSVQGHTWDEGRILREASACEYGIRQYTCTVCGRIRTVYINTAGKEVSADTPRTGDSAETLPWGTVHLLAFTGTAAVCVFPLRKRRRALSA